MSETAEHTPGHAGAREPADASSGKQPEQVRTLGHPLDTVSSATAELFEVRTGGSRDGSEDGMTTAFKVVAAIAIVAIAVAIVVTQMGAA